MDQDEARQREDGQHAGPEGATAAGALGAAREQMPRDLKNWEILRQKGKPRFILVTGVLSYGIPMFVVMTFFVNRKAGAPLVPALVAMSAVIWLLGGALFGWIMWKLNEGRYQKFLAKQSGQK